MYNGYQASEGNTTTITLQVAALDPYPLQGQPNQYFVARYVNGKIESIGPIFVEKTDNLRAFKLRVCAIEIAPLVIKREVQPGEFEYTGLEVTILNELSKYINFTYEIYEPNGTERYGTDVLELKTIFKMTKKIDV